MSKKRDSRSPSGPPNVVESLDALLDDLQLVLEGQQFESAKDERAFITGNLIGNIKPTSNSAKDERAFITGNLIGNIKPTSKAMERAIELLDEAADTDDDARRAVLAQQALELVPDLSQAWSLIAESAESPRETRDLYIKAVEMAERALGDELETLIREGHLWLAMEGRPLLRAKVGLAVANWDIGDRPLAIEQAFEILKLNPNDNQGVRFLVFTWLLVAGSLEQIERLIAMYAEDGSAAWLFNIALHRFRTEGRSPRSRSSLRDAMKSNEFVADFLLGRREPPDVAPEFIGLGDESEAAAYVGDCFLIWVDTPGAREWLEAEVGPGRARQARSGGKKRR